MKIRGFASLIASTELKQLVLSKATVDRVVLDGQNFFYRTYEESGLTGKFGIEGDRYSRYLREYLIMFKKADVKCYFLFKGGHKDMGERLTWYNPSWSIVPNLMKEIYKEILEEMGFEYVVCEYESKKDIIELAQKLNCPVISRDIEICFSGLQYIPSDTLQYNKQNNSISCKCFKLADFLKKHSLTPIKMAVFIVLRDERIFPEDTFRGLFGYLKAPLKPAKQISHLLKYISKYSKDQVTETIFKFISAEDTKKFIVEEGKVRQMIERREDGGLGAACLLDRDAGRIARADPCWFAKGVAAGHVAINYINLYRHKVFYADAPHEGFDNPILVALDIIYYAYDLLTDFNNDHFALIYETDQSNEEINTMKAARNHDVQKPNYEAKVSVFENGWESVRALGLLEHFTRSTLQLDSLRRLSRAPAQARLLLLALAYCARHRPAAPAALPAAALLTHIVLDIVADKCDKNNPPKLPFDRKPILDSTTDSNDVTNADSGIAAAIMEDYFDASDSDAKLLDRNLLHALVEFQQCLLQLSALNALCGCELPAPVLARTYNGTLAYNLLRAADHAADHRLFLQDLLSPAATVNAYFNGLLEAFEDIL